MDDGNDFDKIIASLNKLEIEAKEMSYDILNYKKRHENFTKIHDEIMARQDEPLNWGDYNILLKRDTDKYKRKFLQNLENLDTTDSRSGFRNQYFISDLIKIIKSWEI